MKSSKALSVMLASALVASVAATAAVSASAAGITSVDQIKDHKVGIVGSFNEWKDDVEMTDADGDGIYEAVIDVVAKDGEGGNMQDAQTDTGDGSGQKVSRGFKAITFKVRLDGDWTDSWGDYEASYVRTWNSQTDCAAKVEDGQHVKITVKLDTTRNCDEAVAAGEADKTPAEFELIPVIYTVEVVKDESSVESKTESSTESKTESTTSTTESKTESSTAPATESKTDGTTVPTGDTTSAAALVAVVLASLGTAVVMTKKASAKD